MIGNRKVEGRVCTVLLHVIRKSLTPCENRLTAILNWKKPKYDTVFESRQNASANANACATTTSTSFIDAIIKFPIKNKFSEKCKILIFRPNKNFFWRQKVWKLFWAKRRNKFSFSSDDFKTFFCCRHKRPNEKWHDDIFWLENPRLRWLSGFQTRGWFVKAFSQLWHGWL